MITNNSVLVTKIKEKIKELMEHRNISFYELAQKSELTEACIRNWYTKRNYTPSIEALEKVCLALDIPLYELFSDVSDVMPVSEENRDILIKLQKLTRKQRKIVLTIIDSYID